MDCRVYKPYTDIGIRSDIRTRSDVDIRSDIVIFSRIEVRSDNENFLIVHLKTEVAIALLHFDILSLKSTAHHLFECAETRSDNRDAL
jgi:hypothetical protein